MKTSSSVSLRWVGVVTALSFGQLLLLFVLQLVLANFFGAGVKLDLYLSAYAPPLVLGGIISAALEIAVVPLYADERETRGADAADGLMGTLGLGLLGGALVLTLLLAAAAPLVVAGLYPDYGSQERLQTTRLLRILCWLIPTNTIIGHLYGVFHARKQFFLPAASGLLGPSVTIVLFLYVFDQTAASLAWAVLLGGFAGAGLLLAASAGFLRFSTTALPAALRRLLTTSAPLVLGLTWIRIDTLVDRSLASQLTAGNISHLGYASRLMTAVVTIATTGLSVVIFPSLARHAAAANREQLRSDLAEGWRFLTIVLVPVLAGIALCGRPIIAALLERGEFTANDAAAVSTLLALYGGVVLGSSVSTLGSRACYATGRPWLPNLIGMLGFSAAIAAKFFIVETWRAPGLVVATSACYLVNAALLLVALRVVGLGRNFQDWPATLLRALAATAPAVGAAVSIMADPTPARVACGLAVSILLYVGVMWLLGDEFARRGVEAARAAARRFRSDRLNNVDIG